MSEEDELMFEPQPCSECQEEAEHSGIEYIFDYYVEDCQAYCEYCNRAI